MNQLCDESASLGLLFVWLEVGGGGVQETVYSKTSKWTPLESVPLMKCNSKSLPERDTLYIDLSLTIHVISGTILSGYFTALGGLLTEVDSTV